MAIELSSDADRWLARLPVIVNLLLIALIALSLAHLFWLVWPEPSARAIAPANASTGAQASNQNRIDVDAIADAHIFGQQKTVSADQEKQKELNAPETNLNLVLTGIIADSQDNGSRALIKNPQGHQNSYRIGDAIVSGVDLHAIFPDKVILERGGHFETLTLETIKNAQSFGAAPGPQGAGPYTAPAYSSASTSASSYGNDNPPAGREPGSNSGSGQPTNDNASRNSNNSGDTSAQLDHIRQQILANPSSARRYIRLQPATQNGSLVGYRIFPGEDKALFEKAGLQSGELVTAINGQSLDKPAAALRMLGNLAHASSATITVQDGGQSRTVRVDF